MQRTQLRTTQLGATGLETTRVGFGARAIGGAGWARKRTRNRSRLSIALSSSASTGSTPQPHPASGARSRAAMDW
jgi:hypothetical protein